MAELTTRAITDGKLVGTDDGHATMGVFITNDKTEGNYSITNGKWTHDGSVWSGQPVLFEGTGSSQKIYALSPYVEGATDGTVTITADGKTDYLVAKRTELNTNVASLTMTHALAKLVLKPTFGTELTNQTITSVKVGGMYASGTLDISDNKWNSGDNPATIELTMTTNELLVIPMGDGTSFPITITMEDGRIFPTDIILDDVDNRLEAGTQYNIKLKIGQDKVTLDGITAESWATPTENYEENLKTE